MVCALEKTDLQKVTTSGDTPRELQLFMYMYVSFGMAQGNDRNGHRASQRLC